MPGYYPKGTRSASAVILGILGIIGGIQTGEIGFIVLGCISLTIGLVFKF